MEGIFISVEGPDGAGKSTVVQGLVSLLEASFKKQVLQTREPGGSMIAEEIREVILNPDFGMMDDRTEALLYAASRRQHVMEKILPALEQGQIVLCDRFLDSSLAYQGNARGIGIENVLKINEFSIEGLRPDITIYLDVEAEVGLKRIHEKRTHQAKDRLELEEITFHRKVREGYQKVIEMEPDRFIQIDASLSEEEVLSHAWDALFKRLAEIEK